MNKKIIYVIVAVVVVGAIAAFALYKPSAPGAYSPAGDSSSATPPPSSSSAMSLKGLLSMGGSQRCTFTDTNAAASSQGVVYVAQGQMRGDFTSVAAGKTTQSHMVVKGDTSYVWTDDMASGFKMSLATIENQQAPGSSQGFNPNKDVNYSCGGWSADPSVFTLPSSVTFNDMSNLMPNPPTPKSDTATPPAAGAGAAQCGAVCYNIPAGSSRNQCLAAMGCTK